MASAMPTQVIISNTLDHAIGRIHITDIKTLTTIKEYHVNAGNGPIMRVYGDKLSISNGVLNPGEYILNLQDSSVEYYPERRGTVFFTEDSYMYFSVINNVGEIIFVKEGKEVHRIDKVGIVMRPPNVYTYPDKVVSFYLSKGDFYLVNGNDLSFSTFSLKGYADVIYLNEDKGLAVHGRTLYWLRLSDGQVLKTKKLSFSGNFNFVSKSDDGRFIILETLSMSLVPWSDTFMHERIDLYVFDLQNETLEKLASSVAGNGVGLTVR
ncbi:hypothetical protein [Shewanella sp. SM29]|uniref:hypothetical protein n=1 Tax=Shewanella sp. SM29 TaxID=2912795 RepID=UPI0021D8928D|nr:hypothetical protein [Shewanella sp. SM29]MCU8073877.1 hypothetical protein [Shewanella sp. SM29]